MLLSANIFQPLIDVFAAVLKFFHNDIGLGWGLAIVLLTVCVRLALVPLGMRQFHSMQRMAMHMPELKKLQAKYKDNPERKNTEMMKFYKENSINPFSSCLPLLIQWPFLIGLFWTLRGNLRQDICHGLQVTYEKSYAVAHKIPLHQALGQTRTCNGKDGSGFLFIHDLTSSPHGVEMIILLILYIGTSIGSSLIMMMPGTEKNQKRLMLGLPVVFALITIRFPAGALLYYIVFNLWMVVQQSVFKELIGKQYRHPAGEAIGIDGEEGSVSSGGGLAGLFGLKQGTDDDEPSRPTDKKTSGSGAGRGRGGSTASAEPKAKPLTPKAKPKSGSSNGSSGSNGKSSNANANANGSSGSEKGASASRSGPPPSSPRKRKKRSGRRR